MIMGSPAQAEHLLAVPSDFAPLEQQIALREQLGLSSEADVVRALNEDLQAVARYGMAVSSEEASVLDTKTRLTERTVEVVGFLKSSALALEYDGMYLDPYAAGGAYFRTIGDASVMRSLIAPLLNGFTFHVVRASRSQAELTDAHRLLVRDMPALTAAGARIGAVGLDLPGEAVTVHGDGLNERDLAERYGVPVIVSPYMENAPAAATDLPPRKAGHTITGGGMRCTAAFEVFYYAGNLDNSPNVGTLTAGHCGGNGSLWTARGGNNVTLTIGNMRGDSYDGRLTNTSDGAVIRDLPVPVLNASNRLIDSRSHERRVTGVAGFGSGFDAVGATVCKYGSTSWDTCGVLQDTNLTYTSSDNGKTFNNQRRATVYACFGDSGGPVYGRNSGFNSNATAAGIQSGIFFPRGTPEGDMTVNDPRCINQTSMVYSHVRDVVRDVGIEDGSRIYYVRTATTG